MIKRALKALVLTGVLIASAGSSLHSQEVRTIKLNNDIDQKYLTSKVYELKYINCDDITPWLLGAVYRYNIGSTVNRLRYNAGGNRQFIVVTTGVEMMPYVDDMVAKMDRPSGVKDANNSIVDGTGIYDFTFKPKYRSSVDMLNLIALVKSDGMQYLDTNRNLFYWKDSRSDGQAAVDLLKSFDRPLPQVTLNLNVYEINENDFVELGLDWIAWKNGPGATLMGLGYDNLNFKNVYDISNDGVGNNLISEGGLGPLSGFMFAPQFDSTYLRMLAQKGKAKVATSASLTFVNDYTHNPTSFTDANYRLKFIPDYQSIRKDSSMKLSVASTNPEFQFYLKTPTLCFGKNGTKACTAMFDWVMSVQDNIENANTTGANEVTNKMRFTSSLTMAPDTEKILATYTREFKVNQNNGMPYLSDIPGLKYVFGATGDTTTRTRVFVTASMSPVGPDAKLSDWAGELIELTKLPASETQKTDK